MKSFFLSITAILTIGLVLSAQPPLRSQPRQNIPPTGPNPSPVANPPSTNPPSTNPPATSTSTPQAIANPVTAGAGEQDQAKPHITIFYQVGKRDRLIAVDNTGKYMHRAREIYVYLYCGYTQWQGKIRQWDGLYAPAGDVMEPSLDVIVDDIIEATEDQFKQIVTTGTSANIGTNVSTGNTSNNTQPVQPAGNGNNNPDRIFER